MRRCIQFTGFIFAILSTGAPGAWGDEPLRKSDAPRLVEQALAAGLAGDPSEREQLLAKALQADPNYEPARWQSGQVKFAGDWRSLSEVERMVEGDSTRRRYRELRQSQSDAPVNHEELAMWCKRHGLDPEEKAHWLQVLLQDPSHELARKRLGVRAYRNGFYTREQISGLEDELARTKADFEKYKPQMAALCRKIVRAQGSEREAALEKLRNIDDVRMIDALEYAAGRTAREQSPELAQALHLAVVDAIARMPQQRATHRLLEYAMLATDPKVRAVAARQLGSREVTDYVPQLMAALQSPIEADISAIFSPNGDVVYGETLLQRGPEADIESKVSTTYIPVEQNDTRPGALETTAARNYLTALQQAARAQAAVAVANSETFNRNQRIRSVMKVALNVDLGNEPRAYWQAWGDFNELSYGEHPVITVQEVDDYIETPAVTSCECFMAGTPVWTPAGETPIEDIKVGDLVLAQHPATGEIAFRPVTEKTVGPPSKTVEIQLPGEKIVATPGHRLWVVGRGWEMVKSLAAPMPLYGMNSSSQVSAIAAGEEHRCHNLIVDEFHTFFVGKSRLLVHDKSCPTGASSAIPGAAVPATRSGASSSAFAAYVESLETRGLK